MEQGSWASKLYPRMTEKLCDRMKPLMEEDAEYQDIKVSLLDAVGRTATAYGRKLYAVSGESLKGMNAIQMTEHLTDIAKGVLQGAKSLEDAIFILVKMMLRHGLPHSGTVFLEGLKIDSMDELRRGLESWLSTGMEDDSSRIPG